jgi:hypothetical protein
MAFDAAEIEDAILGADYSHGTSLPERVLEELFKKCFPRIQADTDLLDDLFHRLDDAALKDIKDYYKSHNVTVRLNFPIDDLKFPIVAVLCNSDDENVSADMLGDFMTAEQEVSGTQRNEIVGHSLKSNFSIYCLAGKDSNAAMWLAYVVRALLALNSTFLAGNGLHNPVITTRDISLREDLFPEMTFARIVTLTCDNYFAVRRSERVASALTLSLFTTDENGDNIQINAEVTP